jgi:hypothetical protein
MTLYRLGGDTAGAPAAHRVAVLVAHAVWLAMLLVGGIGAIAACAQRGART